METIKLPAYYINIDKALIEQLQKFYDSKKDFLDFLDKNKSYMTPKKRANKPGVVKSV
jgi:hypothetical protein